MHKRAMVNSIALNPNHPDILPVIREFEAPRHSEFADKSGWSLYQSATEIMKAQSPARQVDGFKALNQVLMAALN
ncbi:MAG: hypothetical protein WCT04_22350 [Planctomycetota bacterium]